AADLMDEYERLDKSRKEEVMLNKLKVSYALLALEAAGYEQVEPYTFSKQEDRVRFNARVDRETGLINLVGLVAISENTDYVNFVEQKQILLPSDVEKLEVEVAKKFANSIQINL